MFQSIKTIQQGPTDEIILPIKVIPTVWTKKARKVVKEGRESWKKEPSNISERKYILQKLKGANWPTTLTQLKNYEQRERRGEIFNPKVVTFKHYTAHEEATLIRNRNPKLTWQQVFKKMKTDIPDFSHDLSSIQRKWVKIIPRFSKDLFSTEEHGNLYAGYEKYGSRWAKYAKLLPNRSFHDIKNELQKLHRKELKRTTLTSVLFEAYKSLIQACG